MKPTNQIQTHSWHTASTGNHQGLIVDDAGNNIAVAYDKAHAPIISAAPELLQALQDCLDYMVDPAQLDAIDTIGVSALIEAASQAIAKATGGQL